MKIYRAGVIGCGRIGGFIDNEVAGRPEIVLPFSHGAGYTFVERTDLAACADLRPDVLAAFGERYKVPPERRYADYREMIEKENLDIVSVTTQPEHRAEIVIFAATNGVRAIYAEKAMAASLAQADAMVEAVEANGVAFNMGTLRRWHPGFDRMKAIIDGGELGALKTVLIYANGTLFNTSSHTFDLAMRLNGDCPAAWVQGHLPRGGEIFEGEILREDPTAHGMIQFENGVTAYAMLTARSSEYEAVCEKGTLVSLNNGANWQVRQRSGNGFEEAPFPEFEQYSPTARLIEDLAHALDTGGPTRGGVRVARANTELIFGFVESHRRGGARVELPLEGCSVRMERQVSGRPIRRNP